MGLAGHPMAEIVRGGVDAIDTQFPTDRWSHFAVVFGTDSTRVYLDGKLVATCEPTSPPEVESPFVIGNVGKRQDQMRFVGKLRSVRITEGERFSNEFTPDQEFAGSSSLLIFDESSLGGGVVRDLSGNGNDGSWDSVVVQEADVK